MAVAAGSPVWQRKGDIARYVSSWNYAKDPVVLPYFIICFTFSCVSFTLTLEIRGCTITSDYFLDPRILWPAREALLQPKALSVEAYHESNSVSEFDFTLRLNLFGLPYSSCIRESLPSVFGIFVIAVDLASLRHRNFFRREHKREAEFTPRLSFQPSPACWREHLQLKEFKFPRATQALNPKDKSQAF